MTKRPVEENDRASDRVGYRAKIGDNEEVSRTPVQLPFGFARELGQAAPPEASRRRLPAEAPARMLVSGSHDALAEEIRLEQAVAGFLPPGRRLNLTLTDNRCNMVTVRRHAEGYLVRAHRMFLGAGPRVVRALARYVVHNDPRASRTLGEFIQANESVVRTQPRKRRALKLRAQGAVHDLAAIFDRLNRERFGGTLEARITWGTRRSQRTRQRSIKMGSFSIEDRIIRIHPVLDQRCVPEYFVAWIVFHEMLHGKHGAEERGGRKCYHTPAFVAEEQSYEHFERAQAWENANMHKLLRAAASG